MSVITIDTLRPEYAIPLAKLQTECYTTLAPTELVREEHFLTQCEICPECNFVVFCDGQPVGLGAGFFYDYDFSQPSPTFMEMLAGGYYTNHQPDGEYYYGADISVHPAYRRRGIGARLYEARKELVVSTNRRGIVAGAVMPGFADHKRSMTAHDYVSKVISGELYDSTLSFQLHNGFQVMDVLENYIQDAASDNWAALIYWENPDYQP